MAFVECEISYIPVKTVLQEISKSCKYSNPNLARSRIKSYINLVSFALKMKPFLQATNILQDFCKKNFKVRQFSCKI